MAGALLGDVGASLFVAGTILLVCDFFLASIIFGDVGV